MKPSWRLAWPLLLFLLVPGIPLLVVVVRNRRPLPLSPTPRLSVSPPPRVSESPRLPVPESPHLEDSEDDAAPSPPDPFEIRDARIVRLDPIVWSAGQTWKVETHYLKMESGRKVHWAPEPIFWRFTVRGIEKFDGRDVWVVDIEPTDVSRMPFDPGGTVYISLDDYAIIALHDRVQENGAIRERTLRLDDGNSAFTSLLPVDLPPPGTEGEQGSGRVGAMAPNPFRPDPKVEPPALAGDATDVTFEVDGETIRQRWDSTVPYWPVYSRTPSKVSYLRKE